MFYQLAGKSRDESPPAASPFLSRLQAPGILSALAQLKYGASQETDPRARYRDEGGGRCGKHNIGGVWKIQAEFSASVTFQALPCGAPGTSSLLLAPASSSTSGPQIGGRRPKVDSFWRFECGLENLHLPFAHPYPVCPGNLCQSVMLGFAYFPLRYPFSERSGNPITLSIRVSR